MPVYGYECPNCGHEFDVSYTLEEYDEKRNATECPVCSTIASRVMDASVGVVFQDFGWVSKDDRLKKQKLKQREKLALKERDMKNAGLVPRLAPNVDGQRVDSWSEAKKLAESKGKDTSGYERFEAKEKVEKVKGIQ